MPVPFSQEIIDRIIDELRGDRSALVASSLVTTSWVSRSRAHLFRNVDWRGLSDSRSVDVFYGDRVEDFIKLIQSHHCTILPHIRRIDSLVSQAEDSHWSSLFDVLSKPPCKVDAARFCHTEFDQDAISDWDLNLWKTHFSKTITTLELLGMRAESGNQMADLIASFEILEDLHMGVAFPEDDEEEDLRSIHCSRRPSSQLQKLTISADCPDFCGWLVETPAVSLTVFRVFSIEFQQHYGRVITTSAHTLHALAIEIGYKPCPTFKSIDFSALTHLKHLALSGFKTDTSNPVYGDYFHLLISLKCLLSTLKLSFQEFDGASTFETWDWSPFEESLAGPAYQSLKRCTIVFDVEGDVNHREMALASKPLFEMDALKGVRGLEVHIGVFPPYQDRTSLVPTGWSIGWFSEPTLISKVTRQSWKSRWNR